MRKPNTVRCEWVNRLSHHYVPEHSQDYIQYMIVKINYLLIQLKTSIALIKLFLTWHLRRPTPRPKMKF